MSRCPKHEPVPLANGNLIDQLAGRVECAKCGMRGQYSNGQRRFGLPRRIIWFTHLRAALSHGSQGGRNER